MRYGFCTNYHTTAFLASATGFQVSPPILSSTAYIIGRLGGLKDISTTNRKDFDHSHSCPASCRWKHIFWQFHLNRAVDLTAMAKQHRATVTCCGQDRESLVTAGLQAKDVESLAELATRTSKVLTLAGATLLTGSIITVQLAEHWSRLKMARFFHSQRTSSVFLCVAIDETPPLLLVAKLRQDVNIRAHDREGALLKLLPRDGDTPQFYEPGKMDDGRLVLLMHYVPYLTLFEKPPTQGDEGKEAKSQLV
ncbi:hypothetical protein FN846DRAFT_908172 [Sphaerosporella brunnea]|uniref:Uncharacterized protein n=1 Tax=Sphaerosporella brunnea TaxID=1250544 RepID=A0A5J5EUG1_9PEZI|nr:hypothetical protein FN846DRAFT_908172 [Sphaerosporella brunnea]